MIPRLHFDLQVLFRSRGLLSSESRAIVADLNAGSERRRFLFCHRRPRLQSATIAVVRLANVERHAMLGRPTTHLAVQEVVNVGVG